jgi:hypothetical protein
MTCLYCGSENLLRNGHSSNRKQRYKCRSCNRQSRDNPQPNGYTQERREEILRAYQERSSLRGIERTFKVSRNTVSSGSACLFGHITWPALPVRLARLSVRDRDGSLPSLRSSSPSVTACADGVRFGAVP